MSTEILPIDWDGPISGIRVAVVALDEFSIPLERRGISARIPADPRELAKFVDDLVESIRKTVMFTITGKLEEEAVAA